MKDNGKATYIIPTSLQTINQEVLSASNLIRGIVMISLVTLKEVKANTSLSVRILPASELL